MTLRPLVHGYYSYHRRILQNTLLGKVVRSVRAAVTYEQFKSQSVHGSGPTASLTLFMVQVQAASWKIWALHIKSIDKRKFCLHSRPHTKKSGLAIAANDNQSLHS